MFNFFKKSSPSPALDLSFLEADMHSHLLPGIDDGAATLEDSLALIRALHGLGYRRLYTTPHVFWEYYQNTPETIGAALATVQQALEAEGLDVELHAAAEYYLDEHFAGLVERNEPLLTLPGRHVLIEMSFFAPYPLLRQTLFDLRTRGYQPILAHPERYPYYANKWDLFDNLRDFGCAFQVNLPAFSGAYGRPVRDFAFKLLERGFVDFIGTDLHNRLHLEKVEKMVRDGELERIFKNREFRNKELTTYKVV
jgi:protein-tyrosine phosphatase